MTYYDLEEFHKAEDYELGMNQGKKDKSIEIAKQLYKDKIPINKIIEYTGLSKENIDELNNLD